MLPALQRSVDSGDSSFAKRAAYYVELTETMRSNSMIAIHVYALPVTGDSMHPGKR